ncbi:hypothetical protein C0995_015308 [Termitomyces sp. Mi166|nr:hypothetical protein C0995_015308 [Termitomyces sp. Mi166\
MTWSILASCALLAILGPTLCGLANSLEVANASGAVELGTSINLETNSTLATCIPNQRKEWRSIEPLERADYLKAVQCLQHHPSKSGLPAARTRFDDFQGFHISVTTKVHEVGQFLPWHRWFLHAYEVALRKECNYTGHIPYWDWTKDADPANPEAQVPVSSSHRHTYLIVLISFRASPLFDAIGGFGNLPLVRGSLSSGVFAKYRLVFGTGPPLNVTDHLIERGFDVTMLPHLTERAVKNTMNKTTFETFRIELEGRPITPQPKVHDSGHLAVGGEMGDTYSSPGDPLFYLHHANLDRLWWTWQRVDPHNRLYQISGRSTQTPPYYNVTLNTTLPTGNLGKPVQIHQVMDIGNKLLCYTYV